MPGKAPRSVADLPRAFSWRTNLGSVKFKVTGSHWFDADYSAAATVTAGHRRNHRHCRHAPSPPDTAGTTATAAVPPSPPDTAGTTATAAAARRTRNASSGDMPRRPR